MADNSKLALPGTFQRGKKYWVKGETLIAWQTALLADRAIAGDGITMLQTPQGRIFTADAGAGAAAAADGPFCKVYPDGANWMLLGGTITGGDGTETVSDITLGTIGSEPADGTFFWIKCNYTGETEDGVSLPGGDFTSAASPDSGTSVPANQMPSAATPAGFVYFVLGEWMGGLFTPSGCGNVALSHCPGNLSHSRL